MWPVLLDMTKEECVQGLRNLELEAYSNLVSALRAQGALNPDKRKLLKETSHALNITQERHKAEVRRAINDEKLNTIAYHISGFSETSEDWAQEGRRLVPLLTRTAPQTVYSAIADEVAETAIQYNKQLPLPAATERKRPAIVQSSPMVPETSKNVPFRIPDPPKGEENKKRKLSGSEGSSLVQHLLAPKLCRIQQLYRQKSKAKPKEPPRKPDVEQPEIFPQNRTATQAAPQQPSQFSNQKVNVLQNISIHPFKDDPFDSDIEAKLPEQNQVSPICSNENQAPRPKIVSNIKPNSSITVKAPAPLAGPSNEGQRAVKTCQTIRKTVNSGQKLIVVSNAQTITSNSILQRTLQMSPLVKNVSIKNLEKFKIVNSNSSPTTITVTSVTNSITNPVKHKVVTVKTNPSAKKVIPLSQLQLLNTKGIKVMPLGGKIVGKSVAGTSTPMYIVNTTHQLSKNICASQVSATSRIQSNEDDKSENNSDGARENGKSTIIADIMKASGVSAEESEDFDSKIKGFHISPMKKDPEVKADNSSFKDCEELIELSDDEEYKCDIIATEANKEQENVQLTEIQNDNGLTKYDDADTEIIESENNSDPAEEVVEVSEILTVDDEEGEVPHALMEVDCSKGDIMETN